MTSHILFTGGSMLLIAVAVMFLGFKFTGSVDWSWWLVLAPMWAPVAAGAALMVIALTLGGK